MRDDEQWDDDVNRFGRLHRRGQIQAQHVRKGTQTKQGHEEHASACWNAQDSNRNRCEQQTVHRRNPEHDAHLRSEVGIPIQPQKPLASQGRAIPENLFSTEAQAEKQRNNDRNEKELRQIFAQSVDELPLPTAVACEYRQNQGQCRCLEQVHPNVLLVLAFGRDVAAPEGLELLPPTGNSRGLRSLQFSSLSLAIGSLLDHVVVVVPLFRRNASVLCQLSVFVHHARRNRIKNLLRVDRTTRSAHGFGSLHLVGHLFEVGEAFQWIVLVNRVAPHIQQQQPIEQLENIRTRLVDDNEYNLTAQRQLLQDVHDVLAITAGQATGGLIHKQHSGLTNQFQGNVQSLALSARNRFVHHGTHAEVADFPQTEATKG